MTCADMERAGIFREVRGVSFLSVEEKVASIATALWAESNADHEGVRGRSSKGLWH